MRVLVIGSILYVTIIDGFLRKCTCHFLCNLLGVPSLCPEEIGARASFRKCTLVCTNDCSYLFGFARAIQDLCIRKREFLVAEACQIFHL